MKVSFWSPYREHSGVTSNILAIAYAINLYFHVRVGVRSNHISNKMMDYYVAEIDHRVSMVASDAESYSRDYPQYMHYLLNYDEKIMAGFPVKRQLGGRKNQGVSMYRPPEPFEESLFPEGDEEIFFLDLKGNNNIENIKAMDEADINVIILPPNLDEIKMFFSVYSPVSKKAIYVINGYKDKSDFSPREIRLAMSTQFGIRKGKIMFIPYYEKLHRACQLGEVDKLMEVEVKARKHSLYFKCVKEIGKKLLIYKARGRY